MQTDFSDFRLDFLFPEKRKDANRFLGLSYFLFLFILMLDQYPFLLSLSYIYILGLLDFLTCGACPNSGFFFLNNNKY